MRRFPRAILKAFVLAVIYSFSVSQVHAEWVELAEQERVSEHQILMAALETHWARGEQGWCRAIIDTRIPDHGVMEVQLWWKGDKIGVQVRPAPKTDGAPPGDVLTMDVVGPKESWRYTPHPTINDLRGYGGKELRRFDSTYECRPRFIWLSPFRGSSSKADFRLFLKDIPELKFYRNEKSHRLRIERGSMRYEFDLLQEYAPVLFELHRESGGTIQNGKAPLREVYSVNRDMHGVVYCQSMVSTTWPDGINGEPTEFRIADILEYDSAPDPATMRLDYKTIGALATTRVTSFIPGRIGSWKYGKAGGNPNDAEEDNLRKRAEELKAKGIGER